MKEIRYIFSHKILLVLFFLIFVLTLIPSLTDGNFGCIGKQCGLIIKDLRDGMWFDAISVVSFKTLPFQMPNFAGEVLKGYHYLPNLLAFIVNRVTNIPIYLIRLRLFPLLYLIAITVLSVKVARKIHDDFRFVFLFCLFLLLGGPLRIITAIYNLNLSELWAGYMINTNDAINIMVSPQTAFSNVLLLLLISNLLNNKMTYKSIFLNSIVLFLLFGTKFYTAFAAVIIFFFYMILSGINGKKIKMMNVSILSITVIIIISYFIFYRTNPLGNNPIFIFSPFSLAHHIIEVPKKYFYSRDLTLQRYFLYSNTKKFSLRLLAIELYSSVLFLIFYTGIRSVGFLYIFFKFKDILKNKLWLSILLAIIPTTLMPLLFIQRGTWFDTAQFLVTSSFILSILSAHYVFLFISVNKKKYIFIIIILSVFFIQNFAIINKVFSTNGPIISQEELTALEILKKAPSGTIFYPIANIDSPYVNVFSEKQSFLNYNTVLDNDGINYKERKYIVDSANVNKLADLNVMYLYIPLNYPTNEKLYFKKLNTNIIKSKKYVVLYSNTKVTIYKLGKGW